MGIKFNNPVQIQDLIQKRMILIDEEIGHKLCEIGLKCYEHAFNNHEYTNRTGNLTTSMGYIVAKDGISVEEGGFISPEGFAVTADKGALKGLELARHVSSGITKGWSLVVVAGMEYAATVETRNYDVLTSAQYILERDLPIMLKKINLL